MFINLCIMMYSNFMQIGIKIFNILNAPIFGTIQNEMVGRSFATGTAINVIHISLSILQLTSSSCVLFFYCQHNCVCTCRYISSLCLLICIVICTCTVIGTGMHMLCRTIFISCSQSIYMIFFRYFKTHFN